MRLLFFGTLCLFAALFIQAGAGAKSGAVPASCDMKWQFDAPQAAADWRAVNDGVMGGRSSGGPAFENGQMVFSGIINTNGGGFSSVRTPVPPGALAGTDRIALRVKSDGRQYSLNMQTNLRYRFRPVTFQAPLPDTPKGQWTTVSIPFDNLRSLVFGQPIMGASFDKTEVRQLGLIISDGKDGPFRLDVEWIKACEN